MHRKIIGNINKILNQFHQYRGKINRTIVYSYWYKGIPNFGDLFNQDLFKFYGLTPIHKPRPEAEVIALGSVLDKVTEDYTGFILGAGLLYDTCKEFPKANILAVRGKLTKERIQAPQDVVLGDPGLLISKIFKARQKKKFVLGLIPHYKDAYDERIKKIAKSFSKDVLVIDVKRKPHEVFKDIDKCEHVLSSSLHGIITADALSIPSAWIYLSDKVEGNGFKFLDYASVFDRSITPHQLSGYEKISDLLKLTNRNDGDIEKVQADLDKCFVLMADSVKQQQRHSSITI